MERFTLKEIKALPTIRSSHFDNLKIDTGSDRIWISRMTIQDGMPYNNQITHEKLIRGNWKIVDQYKPLP